MSRLIDAEKIDFNEVFGGQSDFAKDTRVAAQSLIDAQPTVEAVPVVRCKECKKWHKDIGWCDKHSHFIDSDGSFYHPWESNDWKMFNENDFCSDGERVKDECVCKKERH